MQYRLENIEYFRKFLSKPDGRLKLRFFLVILKKHGIFEEFIDKISNREPDWIRLRGPVCNSFSCLVYDAFDWKSNIKWATLNRLWTLCLNDIENYGYPFISVESVREFDNFKKNYGGCLDK